MMISQKGRLLNESGACPISRPGICAPRRRPFYESVAYRCTIDVQKLDKAAPLR